MIAGTGEKKTLRLVAEHADMCNVLGTPEIVRHLMSVLDRHCEDVGRDPSSICRTVLCTVVVRDTDSRGRSGVTAGVPRTIPRRCDPSRAHRRRSSSASASCSTREPMA